MYSIAVSLAPGCERNARLLAWKHCMINCATQKDNQSACNWCNIQHSFTVHFMLMDTLWKPAAPMTFLACCILLDQTSPRSYLHTFPSNDTNLNNMTMFAGHTLHHQRRGLLYNIIYTYSCHLEGLQNHLSSALVSLDSSVLLSCRRKACSLLVSSS